MISVKIMRYTSIILILVGFLGQVSAQQAKQLQFREETFDFGNVQEDKGPVTHEFLFTNNSNRPVKILTVQASCGCTTPDWSRELVEPGKTGYVQASFNPQGRPGFFTKSLTVTTDLEANPIILQIKGQVSSDTEKVVDDTGFSVSNGSLKFKGTAFNMGKILIKDEFVTKEFPVVNSGSKPVTFKQTTAPKYIKVEIMPSVLAAGAKGTVKVSYNGKLKNQYGFQSDNIELQTNDETNAVKPFSVYATLEDFFPQLSAEEMAKAPVLTLGENSLDFGRMATTREVVREVPITNSGKKDLAIKAVQGNCVCIKAKAAKNVIKPGETSNISIAFDPQLQRQGTQQKAVTIYSNDPRNPVQRFTFTAFVE
jgi:hypothetical protein